MFKWIRLYTRVYETLYLNFLYLNLIFVFIYKYHCIQTYVSFYTYIKISDIMNYYTVLQTQCEHLIWIKKLINYTIFEQEKYNLK